MTKKVLFVNTHSTLNAGDAAIVLSQIRFLRKFYGPVDIALTSRTPELDRKVYASEKVDVFAPIFPAPSVYQGFRSKISNSARDLARRGARLELREAIKEADLVVASGGGYFWSNRRGIPGPMLMQNIMHLRMASRRNKPVILFPQSFGPLFGPIHERMLRRTLEADSIVKIFAREERSAEYLNGILHSGAARDKVEVCPDMAFLLEGPSSRGSADIAGDPLPHPVVAVTVRHWDFPGTGGRAKRKERLERYLEEVEHFCERMALDHGGSILIYSQSRGPGRFEDDRPISRTLEAGLRRNIPQAVVRRVEGRDEACLDCARSALARADLVLATRLHSAILAFGLGIPALAIAYQPKSTSTMRLLGLEEYSFEIECLQATYLAAAAEKILAEPDTIRKQIRAETVRIRGEIEDKLSRALTPLGR